MQDTFAESCDEGETLTVTDALRRLMEDYDDPQTIAAEFKQELRSIEIALGIVRLITQREMDNTVVMSSVSRRKYDFKNRGLFYVFASWQPLDTAQFN